MGENADDFVLERWIGLRQRCTFVSSGGGPIRCPAQLLVTTEASYVLAQFCRRFKTLESRAYKDYVPIIRAGPLNTTGVNVSGTEV